MQSTQKLPRQTHPRPCGNRLRGQYIHIDREYFRSIKVQQDGKERKQEEIIFSRIGLDRHGAEALVGHGVLEVPLDFRHRHFGVVIDEEWGDDREVRLNNVSFWGQPPGDTNRRKKNPPSTLALAQCQTCHHPEHQFESPSFQSGF